MTQKTLDEAQEPATERLPARRDEQPLATIAGKDYAVMVEGADSVGLLTALADNLGGDGLSWTDLTRIKVPGSGGTAWEVPTLGDTVTEKTIEGVIVFWKMIRSYWESNEPKRGTPPDCTSEDTVTGNGMFGPNSKGNPSGRCGVCPMAQWGTGKDEIGQACKTRRLLFVLRPNDRIPVVIGIPPGSLKVMKQYFLQLAGEGLPYYTVATRLGLQKAQSKQGIDFAQVIPQLAGRLTPDQIVVAKGYNDQLRPVIEGAVYSGEIWTDDDEEEAA